MNDLDQDPFADTSPANEYNKPATPDQVSAEDVASSTETDLFDCDVSNIDTRRDVIAPCNVNLRVGEAEVKNSEQKENSRGLHITWETLNDTQGTEGQTLPTGFKFREYYHLTPTEKMPKRNIVRNIGLMFKGLQLQGDPNQFLHNTKLLCGKVGRAKIGIKKASDEFEESNKVNAWLLKE